MSAGASSSSGRNPVIDVAKAIGIICIVIGHTYSPLHDFVYLFHVPLFIFLSGWAHKHYEGFPDFLRRRVISLFVPFVFYGILFLLLHNVFYGMGFNSTRFDLSDAARQLMRIAAFSIGTQEKLLAPLWFLKVLFVISIAYYLVAKIAKGRKPLVLAAAIGAAVCGAVLSALPQSPAFLRVNVTVPVLLFPFYAIGVMGGVKLLALW